MKSQLTNSKRKVAARIRIRQIDDKALAAQSGENAYKRAIENGLPEQEALRLKEIWGKTLPGEHRMARGA